MGGFRPIRRDSGAEAYVRAALCEPLAVAASHGAQPMTQVTQPVWLHRRVPPGDYNASPWIVRREETLVLLGHAQRFWHIRRPDGQIGYVPELLCEPVIRLADGSQATRVRQPIALYNYPAPGGQFSPDRIAATREQLLVLGEDSGFLLVQREDGALGFVPAVLCGPAMPDALLRAGPLDLGWIALGLLWALLNLGALLLLLALSLSGILLPEQALAGFSRPAVLAIVGLFVITAALERTGVVQWLADRLAHLSGGDERRMIVVFMGAGAFLSLGMNN